MEKGEEVGERDGYEISSIRCNGSYFRVQVGNLDSNGQRRDETRRDATRSGTARDHNREDEILLSRRENTSTAPASLPSQVEPRHRYRLLILSGDVVMGDGK